MALVGLAAMMLWSCVAPSQDNGGSQGEQAVLVGEASPVEGSAPAKLGQQSQRLGHAGGAGAGQSLRRREHPVRGVVAIVKATVDEVWQQYDEKLGPRTKVRLRDVVTLAGREPDSDTFSQLGGPMPDGDFLSISELPTFVAGATYLIAFGKGPGVITPTWAGLVFRVLETPTGRLVVAGPGGQLVQSVSEGRLSFGSRQVVEELPLDHASGGLRGQRVDDVELKGAVEAEPAMGAVEFSEALAAMARAEGAPLGASWSTTPDLAAWSESGDWRVGRTSPATSGEGVAP